METLVETMQSSQPKKEIWFKRMWAIMPSWMKKILIALSIITIVYWLLWAIYNTLHLIRGIVHWITDEKTFNIMLLIIIGVSIVAFIYAQFILGLDPIGKFMDLITPYYEQLKSYLINLLP